MKITINKTNKTIICLCACIVILTSIFIISYFVDNKFNSNIARSEQGVTYIDYKAIVDNNHTLNIVNDWEYYDSYLTPLDIKDNVFSPVYLNIGMYYRFNNNNYSSNAGTYRMKLVNTGEKPIYLSLLLPTIYSQKAIYINDELIYEKQEDYIQNNYIKFTLFDEATITIACNSSNHFYGGIVLPPSIGMPENIQKIPTVSQLLYTFVAAVLLFLALLGIINYFQCKQRHLILFSIVAVFCSICFLYPFIFNYGTRIIHFNTIFKNNAILGAILFSVFATYTELVHTKAHRLLVRILTVLCLLVILFSVVILPFAPKSYVVYRVASLVIKLLLAAYIIATSLISIIQQKGSDIKNVGLFLLAYSIIISCILGNKRYPNYTFSFSEWGLIAMFIAMAVYFVTYERKVIIDSLRHNEKLSEEVQNRTLHIQTLLQERKEFLSAVAHDLKSPLASIKIYLDNIKSNTAGENDLETKKYLDYIELKYDSMATKLSALQKFNSLDFTNEAMTSVNLNSLVEELCELIQPETEAEAIYFNSSIPNKGKTAYVYYDKLFSALENIAMNAISFTKKNGTVTIKLIYKGTNAIITISDTGAGISPKILPHIFDKFYSLRNENNKNSYENSGLGLYFAKMAIEEIGGTISVKSEQNFGTTFTIIVPLEDMQ